MACATHFDAAFKAFRATRRPGVISGHNCEAGAKNGWLLLFFRPSYFPKTERVIFFRPDDAKKTGDIVAYAEWDRMRDILGDMLEATEDYPDRYRVRGFPTPAQLASLGKLA